ncbi:discoidin I [Heterostelium album PN500]|uniref:Discoidin I n=1 Tax=Heterostelium pallidum (strain ATCC 26659 / Pp 5 / PN500) TaxID=670386 RepID=D3AY82_HETP5|nr:discoidin I [Heterostelium album PN500]EFA85909.1 discoidin I [Heterostelium album PN500]|eukprot:XP_020438015.1 discoidin I [Heterostelium album PN500]
MSTAGLIPGNAYGTLNVRSSSNWSPDCSVVYSQINYKKGHISSASSSSSWHALTADDKQWVTLSSPVPVEFCQIQTQGKIFSNSDLILVNFFLFHQCTNKGRGDDDLSQWVTSYKIRYTEDGVNWVDGQTFQANTDRHTIVTNTLSPPIVARSIAIHPLTWQGFVTMRFDALYRPIKHTITKTGLVIDETQKFNSGEPIGEKYSEHVIKFNKPFPRVPEVVCALTQIDCAQDKSLRIRVFAKDITKDGFTFVFMTWYDTKLYGLRGSYIATLDQ